MLLQSSPSYLLSPHNFQMAQVLPTNFTISVVHPRRPHRKSRTGCRRCKTRRIKCDESQPSCGNCSRMGISCDYLDLIHLRSRNNTSPVMISRDPATSTDDFDADRMVTETATRKSTRALAVSDRTASTGASASFFSSYAEAFTVLVPIDQHLALRLYHYYLAMTGRSSLRQRACSSWVADRALKTPMVMDAVLGFSAFHLRHHGYRERSLREASHSYMGRAIKSHMMQVEVGVDKNNAADLVASSALIMFHTSVNQKFLANEPEQQLPLHWFRPIQTALSLLHLALPYVHDSGMRGRLKRLFETKELLHQRNELGKFSFLMEGLDTVDLDGETITAYRLALAHLSYVYYSPNHTDILLFPALVTPRFLVLLEGRDPRALAITGYFFTFIKIYHPLWWVDGAAEREFSAVMAELPTSWWPKMGWAMRELGWTRPP